MARTKSTATTRATSEMANHIHALFTREGVRIHCSAVCVHNTPKWKHENTHTQYVQKEFMRKCHRSAPSTRCRKARGVWIPNGSGWIFARVRKGKAVCVSPCCRSIQMYALLCAFGSVSVCEVRKMVLLRSHQKLPGSREYMLMLNMRRMFRTVLRLIRLDEM